MSTNMRSQNNTVGSLEVFGMTPVSPGSINNYKVVSTTQLINSYLFLSTSKASTIETHANLKLL